MNIRKGDKLICIEDINNIFGNPLFIKGEVYEVLYVDNEDIKTKVVLNHILYANEYKEYDLEFVIRKFKKYEK